MQLIYASMDSYYFNYYIIILLDSNVTLLLLQYILAVLNTGEYMFICY